MAERITVFLLPSTREVGERERQKTLLSGSRRRDGTLCLRREFSHQGVGTPGPRGPRNQEERVAAGDGGVDEARGRSSVYLFEIYAFFQV